MIRTKETLTYVAGLKDIFSDKSSSILVAEEGYENTEPSIHSHIVKLKATGADVFVNISSPKFAAQAIKKMPRDRVEADARDDLRPRSRSAR